MGGIRSSIIRGRLYLAMGIFSGLGQVLMALAPNMAFAFGAAVIMGASQAAFMTMGQATMQARWRTMRSAAGSPALTPCPWAG